MRKNFEQENTGNQGAPPRKPMQKPEVLSESNAELADLIKNDPDYYKDSPKTDPIKYKELDTDRNGERDQ